MKKRWRKIPGIGKSIALKIKELAANRFNSNTSKS